MVITDDTKMSEVTTFLQSRRLVLTLGSSDDGPFFVKLTGHPGKSIDGFGTSLLAAVGDAFEQLTVLDAR